MPYNFSKHASKQTIPKIKRSCDSYSPKSPHPLQHFKSPHPFQDLEANIDEAQCIRNRKSSFHHHPSQPTSLVVFKIRPWNLNIQMRMMTWTSMIMIIVW